ncbi:DUF6803 family protein [uncultured Succinivibrio sp.]|uniref:DUF6803 family protein n=1 Tax=uncultured Succinivibrio sp. TaxID=540749 RepID=UPI0025DAF03C|nr:DUF6803 family protein [uncultured Succinivibrio sp.]
MYMTHYMELLTTTSNLLIFMALPVVLAETAAITELIILFTKENRPILKLVNKISCLLGAAVFLVIDIYIFKEVIVPLTENSSWYGLIDKIAVGFYVLGGVVMVALGLFSFKSFGELWGQRFQTGLRVGLLSGFLVISHVAMIAGMADPRLDSDYRSFTEGNTVVSESVLSEDSKSVHSLVHNH